MEHIFKYFKHLSRDLYIYIIPGINVLLNCYLFLLEPNDQNNIQAQFISFYQNTGSLVVIASIIFVCFIIGHISMAVSEMLTAIYKYIKRIYFKEIPKNDNNEEIEIVTFEKREEYEYFVERDSSLHLFRWNLAGTFLLLIIISFFLTKSCLLMVTYFLLSVAVYYLSLVSEKTFINRRQQLYNKIKEKASVLKD